MTDAGRRSRLSRRSRIGRALASVCASVLLLATGLSGARAQPPADLPLPQTITVAEGVFVIPGAPGPASPSDGARLANVAYVVGKTGVLVWNTGVSHRHGQQLLANILDAVDRPIRLAIVSHAYQDVLFGWSAFNEIGIPVWMHQGTELLMRQRCHTCLERLTELLGAPAMFGTRLVEPAHRITGSENIDTIGRPMALIDSQFSSGPNDLMLFDHATGTLFSGVTVQTDRLVDIHDGRYEGWIAALEAVQALPVRHVVPDYGAIGDAGAITRTLAYLSALDRQVTDMLDRGITLSAAIDSAPLTEFAQLRGYQETHGRNIQTRYLALESRYFK